MAKKSFYLENDRLFYIKNINCQRYDDGSFENINEVELKKIPYIFEILPFIEKIHEAFGHIQPAKLSKLILKQNFYIKGLDIITEQ